MPSDAAVFAAMCVTLWVAHTVADHYVQTDQQAQKKAHPDWAGRWACTAHVATYLATQVLFVATVALTLGVPIHPGTAVVAAVVSGGTHWIIDRRWPLEILARLLGKEGFYHAGARPVGHGGYVLDQAGHALLSVWVPALILAL